MPQKQMQRSGRWQRRAVLAGLCVAHGALFLVAVPVGMWVFEADSLSELWRHTAELFTKPFAQTSLHDAFSTWTSALEQTLRAGEYAVPMSVLIGVMAVAPTLFIAPLVGPVRAQPVGRPMRGSVLGAGMLAGVVSACFILSVFDLAWLVTDALLAKQSGPGSGNPTAFGRFSAWLPWGLVAAWLVSASLWTAFFALSGRSRHPSVLVRWFRWLMAGTATEMALAVSVLVWARRRDSCVCDWGSYWALVWGLASMVVLCGPGVVLLLSRRARQQWGRTACPHCGYPRRTDAVRCSECGGQLTSVA